MVASDRVQAEAGIVSKYRLARDSLQRSSARDAGVSAEVIRVAGGWADLATVQRSYFGLQDEDVAEALRRIG